MVFTPPSVPPSSGDRNVIGGQKRYRGTETLSGESNPLKGRNKNLRLFGRTPYCILHAREVYGEQACVTASSLSRS